MTDSDFLDRLRTAGLVRTSDNPRQILSSVALVASSSPASTYVWRGQDCSEWLPVPGLYRRVANSRKVDAGRAVVLELEHSLIRAVRDRSLAYGSDIAIGALLQHTGAATRLLDVTIDPMASLWFAVNDERHWDKPGIIYAFDTSAMGLLRSHGLGDESKFPTGGPSDGFPGPVEDRGTFVDVSRDNDRIKAQRGAFILLPLVHGNQRDLNLLLDGAEGWSTLEAVLEVDSAVVAPPAVLALEIAPSAKPALKELLGRAFGYDSLVVYPDLPGFCSVNSAFSEIEDGDVPTVDFRENDEGGGSRAFFLDHQPSHGEILRVATEAGFAIDWVSRVERSYDHPEPLEPVVLVSENGMITAAGEATDLAFDESAGEVVARFNERADLDQRFRGRRVSRHPVAPTVGFTRRDFWLLP